LTSLQRVACGAIGTNPARFPLDTIRCLTPVPAARDVSVVREPSRGQRVDVVGRLFVRVRGPQRGEDVREPLGGHDRLDAQLGDALLAAGPAERRARPLPAEEGARPGRVPGAALVRADPPRTGREDGVPGGVERLLRDEPDELVRGSLGRHGQPSGANGRPAASPTRVAGSSVRSTWPSGTGAAVRRTGRRGEWWHSPTWHRSGPFE